MVSRVPSGHRRVPGGVKESGERKGISARRQVEPKTLEGSDDACGVNVRAAVRCVPPLHCQLRLPGRERAV